MIHGTEALGLRSARLVAAVAGVVRAFGRFVRRGWSRHGFRIAPDRGRELLGVGVIATGCLLATACGSSNTRSPGAANTTTTSVTTAAAAGAATVAATSTAASAPTQTTSTQADLEQSYLAIIEPTNAALGTFETKSNSWTKKTTNVQATTDATPFLAAVQQARDKLLHVQWPASTQADVNYLVRTLSVLSGDLGALATVDMPSVSSWVNRFMSDATSAGTAAAAVRVDLSPPAPG
jgi:hypothetical protein